MFFLFFVFLQRKSLLRVSIFLVCWVINKVTRDHGDEGDAFVTKWRKNKVTK